MNIKSCPLCRAPSAFVTPTSILPSTSTAPAPISIASTSTLTSADGKGAEDTKSDEHPTTRYLASTRRVLCKHFVSTSDKPDGPCCPFGDDCLYHHPTSSGERHVFGGGVRKYMPVRISIVSSYHYSKLTKIHDNRFSEPEQEAPAPITTVTPYQ